MLAETMLKTNKSAVSPRSAAGMKARPRSWESKSMKQSELGEHESAEPEEPWRNRDWLRERWYSDMATAEIAEEAGCSDTSIRTWACDEFGFDRRPHTTVEPWQDPEVLRQLYYDEKMSQGEIAEKYGKDQSTIHHWMEKCEVKSRPSNVTRVLRDPGGGFVHADIGGYEQINTGVSREESENTVVYHIHRLCAMAWFGIDAVKGNHVHHKNGIPWDNREENLEVLSESEHRRHHAEKRPKREDGKFA